ncbi:tetratricopeptide repeat protein [Oceanobacter mangrovi]|uniref:tetratricopeptide repeat protein n=1 Tax=Oceanobacter mangrovi TaxID=2862510 RepID=UPI001C8E5578|nr:tetratricopeptide repeat protein [Oceanobacter mangrovi]
MFSSKPTTQQVVWYTLFIHLGVMIGFEVLFSWLQVSDAFTWSFVAYFALYLVLRRGVARHHRAGMSAAAHAENFEQAMQHFQDSYDFFSRHLWIDKGRYLFLLSCSKPCYRELALVNIGSCLVQMGRGKEAIVAFERALQEFPDSELAKQTMNTIRTFSAAM